MFSSYLVHFCGRAKEPEEADKILWKILRSGKLIPGSWKILEGVMGDLLEAHELRSIVEPSEEEREVFGLLSDIAKRAGTFRVKMVCFTDIPLTAIREHAARFGHFGVALKKSSEPCLRCEPVRYITKRSPLLNQLAMAKSLNEKFLGVLAAALKQTLDVSQSEKLDETLSEHLDRLVRFDLHRMSTYEDARYLNQHEWRFVQYGGVEELTFKPDDIAFIVVDTIERAARWNHALFGDGKLGYAASPNSRDLTEYGNNGVMAIPLELFRKV